MEGVPQIQKNGVAQPNEVHYVNIQQEFIMNKKLLAFMLETSLFLALTMATLPIMALCLRSIGIIGKQQIIFMIWSFQMGFSGTLYMIAIPAIRVGDSVLTVRAYHYLFAFLGLVGVTFFGINLLRVNALDFWHITLFATIPPIMTIAMLIIRSKEKGQKTVPSLR